MVVLYISPVSELTYRTTAGLRLFQRLDAADSRNSAVETTSLYHSIGKDILLRQASEGWGAKVIQRLSADLGEAFPDMKGFSASNLK